jgi:hypothetical protein
LNFDIPAPDTLPTAERAKPIRKMLSTSAAKQELIDGISAKFTLNREQHIAFSIIAKSWLAFNEARNCSADPDKYMAENPLHLLLTGPGGTGKTHVAAAQQHLMEMLNCGHRIKVIAPTASAAKTANGQTIHGGLKIRVRKSGTINRDSSTNFYTVDITDSASLREDWKYVDIVLVDEISLLGLVLLAQIDYALRKAKECPDVYFGGCNMILCGDLYQHSPVGGYPVYSRAENTKKTDDKELLSRLG